MRRILTISLLCLLALMPARLVAQAGKDVYQFLSLPSGARQAGMGGTNVSLFVDDLNFAFANPALLSDTCHNYLGLNYTNQFLDVNTGSAIYARTITKNNHIAVGINYVDYGRFLETNIYDEQLGTFTAKDIALSAIYTRRLSPRWNAGVTLKPIFSFYERYQSYGLAFDIGLSYHHEKALFSAGLVLRNAGFQFAGYHSIDGHTQREPLPLDLQFGVSQQLPKAPLRFSLTFHNMQTWDLSYGRSPEIDDPMASKSAAARGTDMFFRHTIFALEILPTKSIYLAVSYNHRRRREMAVQSRRSVAGFAFGAGVKVYRFNVGFSVVPYQTGSLGYNVTLSTNLSQFGVH